MTKKDRNFDACVVGGAGHIGLPLAILLAHRGYKTLVYDINRAGLEVIQNGVMPFFEHGAEELLKQTLNKNLFLSDDVKDIRGKPHIIITIGTPVDEFLNPTTKAMSACIDNLFPILEDGQLLVLRSTVSPGITEWLDRYIEKKGKKVKIAFCPERVVQGFAIHEIQTLPQIVSGTTPEAESMATELFSKLAPEVVHMKTKEAEFAKLFSNAYRYIQFATTNQFYMLATMAGLDYAKILEGMSRNYPRNQGIPRPGFAGGPCLFKDTMQLAAFANNQFSLGMDAMNVNEGLPLFLIDQIKKKCNLRYTTVGLLGMAFKSNSDDIRSSLSYKLKKVLKLQAKEVFTTDPLVKVDPELISVEQVIEKSDLLILCTPHQEYAKLNFRGKPVIDVWNFYGKGTLPPNLGND